MQGVLPADNIGTFPASKISGPIPANLIRGLSHTTLTDIGTLTHPEIDDLLEVIGDPKFEHIGVVNAINILQASIVDIHEFGSESQRYRVNTRAIVPGLTPDTWMDEANSNATISKGAHTVTGTLATVVSPAQTKTLEINQVTGPAGFSGPSVTDSSNLTTYDNPVHVNLTELYKTTTRWHDGEFYVDFNAGSVVDFQTLTWTGGVFGSAVALGTGGLDFTLYGRTAMTRQGLETGAWVTLGTSLETSADLSTALQANRWIRVKGAMTRGETLTAATPLFESMALSYNIGNDSRCAFLFYPDLDEWALDEIENRYTTIQVDDSIKLIQANRYVSQAVWSTPVLDGGPDLLQWGKITPSFTLPPNTAISVKVRESPTSFVPTDTLPAWQNLSWSDSIEMAPGTIPAILTGRYTEVRFILSQSNGTAPVQTTPDLMNVGISLFDEARVSEATLSNLYYDGSGGISFTCSASHNFMPGSPILISGGTSATLSGQVMKLSLASGSTGAGVVLFTGGTIGISSGNLIPLQSRIKEWHASNSGVNGWNAAGAAKTNVSSELLGGAITLTDTNKPGQWVSPPYKVPDTKFKGWDNVKVYGEGLGLVTVSVQFSDNPGSNDWTTGYRYQVSGASSPLSVPIRYDQYGTKSWIRIVLDISPV